MLNASIQQLDSLFQFLSTLEVKVNQAQPPVKHGDFIFSYDNELHWVEEFISDSSFTALRVNDQRIVTLQVRHVKRFASKREINRILNIANKEGVVL